jgi:hypothetical protein
MATLRILVAIHHGVVRPNSLKALAMHRLSSPELVPPRIGAPQLFSIQVIEITESGYRGRAKEVRVDELGGASCRERVCLESALLAASALLTAV